MSLMKNNLLLACLITASYGLVGCGQNPTPPQVAKADQADHSSHKDGDEHHEGDGHDHDKKKAGHSHDGWWCDEHGVPEEVCALCNSKVAAEFQKKGDWCKEHDRPDSQCFKCHPELQGKFAAQYEAKFGKKPPTPGG